MRVEKARRYPFGARAEIISTGIEWMVPKTAAAGGKAGTLRSGGTVSSRVVACYLLVALVCIESLQSALASSSMQSAARGMQREVGEENKGFQMLRKMGWRSGAIGQSQDGLVEPIDPLANPNAHTSPRKSGLGTSPDIFSGGMGGGNRKQRRGAERGMGASSQTFVSPKAFKNREKQLREREIQVKL